MSASDNNPDTKRKWISTTLLGSHMHSTENGYRINISLRDGRYIARGRYQGIPFIDTLGSTDRIAASRLRQMLCDLESETYSPPRQRKLLQVQTRATKSPTFSGLVDIYLRDVRKTKGLDTATDYCSKLAHLERFAAQPENRRRWPTADRIDRDFVVEAKAYLQRATIFPNGHAHSKAKLMSPGQIHNVISACSTMIRWALRPDIRRLPIHWPNPFTRDVIGTKPTKDPLRKLPLDDEHLFQLIKHSDAWQLCHLMLHFVFPLRPEESAGLLVEDVDFDNKLLRFGTRMEGCDFTKGKQSFVLPFPDQIAPLLRHLVAGRTSGPLLRKRKHYLLSAAESSQLDQDKVEDFRSYLMVNSADVHTLQDKKRCFRKFLVEQGGLLGDNLSKEFKKIRRQADINTSIKLYDLRSLNTTKMYRAGVKPLALGYFTGHATSDILHAYIPLDPQQEIHPYFNAIQPVLDLLTRRAMELGMSGTI